MDTRDIKIKTGSDFSGVGAFDQALNRLGIEQDKLFACDMDKYARQTYIHNYGEPKYYPSNVYEREIPKESLDIYMTSPPCQSFSLAGKRKGEDSKNGVLFYNSHEFIVKNKPRYFIFENVKGLLSDNNGTTFQRWCAYLGGKSVNGNPVIFPMEESVPYHVYYKVLNAKDYGVPQNRERIFIIGIRDDADNNFRFPKEEFLYKRLKDVLEDDVDEKYYLSDKAIQGIINSDFISKKEIIQDIEKYSACLLAGGYKDQKCVQVKSATSKGYEEAKEGDSINLEFPDSKTRRGRVGKGVAQTLDTGCNQGVWAADHRMDEGLRIRKEGITPCITTGEPIYTNEPQIRRLTPRECFRLIDFPDTFDFSVVSNSQAYKQAGNSIVVAVLEKIIKNLNL